MTTPPDFVGFDYYVWSLAQTLPGGTTPDGLAVARAALEALEPRDGIEAMLGVQLIATRHAISNNYHRAKQPGVSAASAANLCKSAQSLARAFDATLLSLEQRRARVARPAGRRATRKAQPVIPAPPSPHKLQGLSVAEITAAARALDSDPVEQLRLALAERIPMERWQDMTMQERSIAFAPSAELTPAQAAVRAVRLDNASRKHPTPEGAKLRLVVDR
jgi:hypothetical protein